MSKRKRVSDDDDEEEEEEEDDLLLLEAVHDGNYSFVEELLEEGVNANAKKDDGSECTALHSACDRGHSFIVGLLIDSGANLNAKDKNGDTPLHTACTYGSYFFSNTSGAKDISLGIIKLLLGNGADPNVTNNTGRTPLHGACESGYLEAIKLLVEHGANGNVKDEKGCTPMGQTYDANLSDWFAILKLLVEKGNMDIKNATMRNGKISICEWALYWAFEENHQDLAQFVIENGDSEKLNAILDCHRCFEDCECDECLSGEVEKGNTLLHAACKYGYLEIAKSLIKIGADMHAKNSFGRTPLRLACRHGYSKIVKFLVENGAIVHSKDENGAIVKSKGENGRGYCCLCEGFHPQGEFDGWTLCWACDGGHLEVVKSLIKMGGNDFNAKYANGETPLHWTIFNCSRKVANVFLYNEFRGYEWKEHLRFEQNCRFMVAKFLIENGADVNAKDDQGKAPLHWALENCQQLGMDQLLEIFKLLVENGADLNVNDNGGNTPLHRAFKEGNREVAKLLIENGADCNAKDKGGNTSLHVACDNRWNRKMVQLLETTKFLVENGASLNVKNNNGRTPLRLACDDHEGFRVVKLLIKNGAEVNTKDNDGETPLHGACLQGNLNIVKLLLRRGANVNAKTTKGNTPLHAASIRKHSEVVWFLVRQHPWLVSE